MPNRYWHARLDPEVTLFTPLSADGNACASAQHNLRLWCTYWWVGKWGFGTVLPGTALCPKHSTFQGGPHPTVVTWCPDTGLHGHLCRHGTAMNYCNSPCHLQEISLFCYVDRASRVLTRDVPRRSSILPRLASDVSERYLARVELRTMKGGVLSLAQGSQY